MNLFEEILALLKAQFPGVREDGLKQLAAAIGLQVETKEQAAEIVGKITADKVDKFVKDWRSEADKEISKANQTHEASLKEKYEFVEKGKPQPPVEQPLPPKNGEITLEAISKLIDDKMKNVESSLSSITAEKTAATRKAAFVAALDKAQIKGKAREMQLSNFGRMNFKDDEDFNGFLSQQETQLAALAQEEADKGLQGHEKPVFGAVNKDGVSSGVADYIAQRNAETAKPQLQGKEI